jgi:EmrB/QacA subfamily drug resistance transporter
MMTAAASPAKFPFLVPLIIATALFMENLDASVIATALPAISRSLHVDPLHLNLAITSYLFSLAVFIPLSGWMADKFGARRVFCTAIAIFTLSSIACGLSENLIQLVSSRLLQGLGGAMMVPVGRLVILRSVPKSQLVSSLAWLTIPALIGPVLGPPVGGLIVTVSSWHWIFFINVPIGILGIFLALRYVPNVKEPDPGPLDVGGFFLMALALSGLVFGFETVGRNLIPAQTVELLLGMGALCGVLYVSYARRNPNPIIDLKLLKLPTFYAGVIGGSLFRVGIGAMPFLLPLMLQIGFGLSPLNSGLITFASAAGAMAMKMSAARIIRTWGFRRVLIVNAIISAFYIAGCALFAPSTPHALIFLFLLAGGFFRSLQFTSLNVLSYADVPQSAMSRATTFASMMQQLSLSFGVGLGAVILNITMHVKQSAALSADDFWPGFVAVSALSMISILFFIPLPKNAGEEVSGQQVSVAEAVKEPEP